ATIPFLRLTLCPSQRSATPSTAPRLGSATGVLSPCSRMPRNNGVSSVAPNCSPVPQIPQMPLTHDLAFQTSAATCETSLPTRDMLNGRTFLPDAASTASPGSSYPEFRPAPAESPDKRHLSAPGATTWPEEWQTPVSAYKGCRRARSIQMIS